MTRFHVTMLSLCVVLGFGVVSKAHSMSYSSFSDATFYGVTLTPSFATGVLDYTLTLAPTGKIKIGSNLYDILWIQGLYVVGATSSDTFTATNGAVNPTGWKWKTRSNPSSFNVAGWAGNAKADRIHQGESKTDGAVNTTGWKWKTKPNPSPFNVAGWAGNAEADRIHQGESKTFQFGSLNLGDPTVPTLIGLHVGYDAEKCSPVTAYFKGNDGTIPPLPEPSSLFGLGTGLMGAVGLYSRRRNRKN